MRIRDHGGVAQLGPTARGAYSYPLYRDRGWAEAGWAAVDPEKLSLKSQLGHRVVQFYQKITKNLLLTTA